MGHRSRPPRWFSRGTDDHEIILGQEKCPSYCGLNHGDVRRGALQFILTQRLTSNHRFLSPCCLFNCLCWLEFALLVFLSPDCPCFCVCVHAPCACVYVCLTVCAPPLSRAPLSLPVSRHPCPQHSQASLCTRSLRWWRRMGLLGLSATLKGCQLPSSPGRRTRSQCRRSLGEYPVGEWGEGPSRLARESPVMCSGTRILRATVAPFARTDLGANCGLALPSLRPQREAGQAVLFPAKNATHEATELK